jgi:hypothetical protein
MTLTVIAARLRLAALNIEGLPPEDREADIPDQLVAQLVMDSFVDDRLVEAFRILRIREERRYGRPNQPVPPAALPRLRSAADYPEDLSSSSYRPHFAHYYLRPLILLDLQAAVCGGRNPARDGPSLSSKRVISPGELLPSTPGARHIPGGKV